MAGKRDGSAPWRQTSIVIRADILEQATQQKLDISQTCNQALAERLGIDIRQQKIPEGSLTDPVIIAPNVAHDLPTSLHVNPGASPVLAIINADDPHAAKTVKSRRLLKEKPVRIVPAPVAVEVPVPEKATLPQSVPSVMGTTTKPAASQRKKKDDSTKKFFAAMIIREDSDASLLPKDDMYYAFERWCRDHRILIIPDKKSFSITLKNQFAVKEQMVNSSPSWVGVQLKK